ncbi:MAG: CDP-alcohol phosphatidyltransferase family protein [Candidatus Omnitrophota bacterium]
MSFADKISSIRIILIPVFVSLLIYSETHPTMRYFAVAVFVLAVLSDFFDGMVARIKKEKSELGQIIDPLADKLLLLTAFITLLVLEQYPMYLWLVLIVVSRDLIISFGFAILKMLKIEVEISPSAWGKFTTFSQMITILWILLNIPYHFYISLIAAIFTLISGLDYFLRGVKVLNAKVNSSNR